MNTQRNTISWLLALALLISACSGPATVIVTPTPSSTPQPPRIVIVTATPTRTPRPTNTPSDTPEPTDTPAPTATATALGVFVTFTPEAVECQPKWQFVEDVETPDGTVLDASEPFTKTWRVRNVACEWRNYTLEYLAGTLQSDVASVDIPTAQAGQAVDITVNQISPQWSGDYVSFWAMNDQNGETFGILTIVVTVKGTTSSQVVRGPNNCELDDSYVADMNFLDGAQVFPGEKFSKVWRIVNNGTCPHGEGYELVFVTGNITPIGSDVPQIPEGAKGDVEAMFKAPEKSGWYYALLEVRAPNGASSGTLTVIVRVDPTSN